MPKISMLSMWPLRHNLHHEGVTLALNAGKHVLVEKPIALSYAQALKMVELARRKRLFFRRSALDVLPSKI